MSNTGFVVATLYGSNPGTKVYINLDQVVTATPAPQVIGGPNTLHANDGTTYIVKERLEDLAGFL